MQKRIVLSIRKTFHYSNNNKNGDETIKIIIVVFDLFIQLCRIDRYSSDKGTVYFSSIFDCMHGQTSNIS